ncbi:hypothetical protein L2747_19330 [Shewanella marinintestina]|uniref:hypothetical protein n=1 Tax=Shewanella marinintestina TaxID=190305 RepID=UPI00200C4565|nr:hypothetical protein [Shewanella marinintestina]MCL1148161.1 hypothetical protein [Shewanella marinintestina]
MDFIYAEISAIDKQISMLSQTNDSPFEFFSASPYQEEQVSYTHLHKVALKVTIVKGNAEIYKGLNELNGSLSKSDTAIKTQLDKSQVTLMYNLMQLKEAIGEFNQFIEDYPYIKRTKLDDAQASFDEWQQFDNDYDTALDFTYEVFSHFYTLKKNKYYKVHTLINTIEAYCISQRVPYPRSRESKGFNDLYSKIIIFATDEARSPGRSLKGLSVIDADDFAKEYGHLLLKN